MIHTVVIVTPGFPANEQDTTCLPAFQQFALSLKKNFPEKHLVVVTLHYPFVARCYAWNEIDVVAMGGKNKRHFWNWLTQRKTYKALDQLRSKKTIDGIISLWCTDTALVANRFAAKNKIRHLIWVIGQDAKKENRHVSRIQPESLQLMAMSDFLQEEFYKNHAVRPAAVIENGINREVFPPFNTGERPIDIFGAGSLIPLKNYSLFIELVAELKKQNPGICAVLAGDGRERDLLMALIKKSGLENNVQLAGLKTHAETLALMSQSKVFLHTSHYEGNSTVLMEALYSGCQVVSMQPLSHRGTEQLFVGGNKARLVEKLKELFSGTSIPQKQIVFNTMDDSVRKIMKLLLQ